MYISKLFFLNVLCLFYIDKVQAFNSSNFTTIRDYRDRHTHGTDNYTTASVNASFFGIQPLSAEARCTDGTSEVARTLAVYNVGSDSGKADLAIHSLDTLMGYFGQTNRLSFKYQTDDIVGFMWLGSMVQNQGANEIMQKLQDIIKSQGMKDTIYAQYTDVSTHDPAKGFGIILNTQGDLDMVQAAVRSWSRGHDFRGTDAGRSATINSYLCYTSYADRKTGGNDGEAGDCEYKRMTSGANVGDLCGTTSEAVQMYNPDIDFTKLAVGQPICCTEGKSPDLRPSKNSDGSCKVFQFKDGNSCATVKAKYYPLSDDELNKFNKKTFGWYGCKDQDHLPQIDQKICVSDGTPPRPEPNPEAECGPLAPGDKYNSECPLNACCSEFGFCGLTDEFCATRKSDTGAPGTTGCVSNCGLPTLPSKGHAGSNTEFKNIQYFMTSDGPLKGDPLSIDADIVHFGFIDIGDDLEVKNIDDNIDFKNFLDIHPKRVASFGGWDFSTNKDTYNIFRKGVTKENRDHFANTMIAFLNEYQLDGLDFDWEYPGAPDDQGEGLPLDDPGNGYNYLEFLKIVRDRLPSGKTISVALPASYWYLKAFPVEEMQHVVDYFIFMNYDYYGQWDYGENIGVGCHVAYTNTTQAIAMLNKAGVKSEKIVGGLANYGRSYQLADPTCTEIGCPFTGPSSNALEGPETQTAGILSINEINEMKSNYSDYKEWKDGKCTIATFSNDNWVGFMKEDDRKDVADAYKDFNYFGSVTWLSNYEDLGEPMSGEDRYDKDYLGEIDGYNDIFNCYNTYNIDSINDIDNVIDICKYHAGVNYLLHLSDSVKARLQSLLNDENYSKHYKTYATYIQQNITGNMGYYAIEYWDRFKEDKTCHVNVYNPGAPGGGGGTQKCGDKATCFPRPPFPDPRNDDACNTHVETFSLHTSSFVLHDYIFKNDKYKKEAADKLSNSLDMNITTGSFSILSIEEAEPIADQNVQYSMYDSEIPSVAKLIPDPMGYITQQNITDISDLQSKVKESKTKSSPEVLFNLLLPVTMYVDVVDNAETINKIGAKIEEMQKKETKEMIKNIIFSIFGVLSMAAGPEIGLLIDTMTVLVELGIDGTPDIVDVSVLAGGVFGFVFKEVKQVEHLASIASKVDKITIDGKTGKSLSKVKTYRNLMSKYGSSCKA